MGVKRPGPLAGSGGKHDFKKRKARVGKKAVKPANLTKVNLKAKQLYMPNQRLITSSTASSSFSSSSTASSIPATSTTGKTLPELLHQCHHHHIGTRAMAMQGLRELALAHPHAALRDLSPCLDAALELLLDPEQEVRTATLACLRVLLLLPQTTQQHQQLQQLLGGGGVGEAAAASRTPTTTATTLQPFLPLFATYLCSTLTHLDQSIRKDGMAWMDMLVTCLGTSLRSFLSRDILPNLGSLLEKPPLPSKRKAARLLLVQQGKEASGGGGGRKAKEGGMGGKDQVKKARGEMWLSRLAVARSVLGVVRLLEPAAVEGAAGAGGEQRQQRQKERGVAVVEWQRQPRLLLLRATADVAEGRKEGRNEREREGGATDAALRSLLPKVTNYILEMTTTRTAQHQQQQQQQQTGRMGGKASEMQRQQKQQQQQQQIEGGPVLDVLGVAIELALVASQRLQPCSSSSSSSGSSKGGKGGKEGGMGGLDEALASLFPVQLADGGRAAAAAAATTAAGSGRRLKRAKGSRSSARADGWEKVEKMDVDSSEEEGDKEEAEEEEGEEEEELAPSHGISISSTTSEGAINLALIEVMVSSRSGRALPRPALAWLFSFLQQQQHQQQQRHPSLQEGTRLIRLLTHALPPLFLSQHGDDERLAERLLEPLETCLSQWPISYPPTREGIRLLSSVLPYRDPAVARRWVTERATAHLIDAWTAAATAAAAAGGCGGGGAAAASELALVLLRALKEEAISGGVGAGGGNGASGDQDGEQERLAWLPLFLAQLLHPSALCHLSPEVQFITLDLLYYCPPSLPLSLLASLQALAHACAPCPPSSSLPPSLPPSVVRYMIELLHHRKRTFTPAGYLTLLGSFLAFPPPLSPTGEKEKKKGDRRRSGSSRGGGGMHHAHVVGEAVGRSLLQLVQQQQQQGEGEGGREGGREGGGPLRLLTMLTPTLVQLMGVSEAESSSSSRSSPAARRAALVVVSNVAGGGGGEGRREGGVLPDALIAPLVQAMLVDGEEEEREGGREMEMEERESALSLHISLFRDHPIQLLPSLLTHVYHLLRGIHQLTQQQQPQQRQQQQQQQQQQQPQRQQQQQELVEIKEEQERVLQQFQKWVREPLLSSSWARACHGPYQQLRQTCAAVLSARRHENKGGGEGGRGGVGVVRGLLHDLKMLPIGRR